MDFSKLSDSDLIALKNGRYEAISDEGLQALKGQTVEHLSAQQQSVQGGWEGITPKPLIIPEEAPAQGLGALGELAGGKDIQQASQVASGQSQPTTIPGNIGKGVGTAVSPSNIAMAALPLGNVNPIKTAAEAPAAIADTAKTLWGTNAINDARNAVNILQESLRSIPLKTSAKMAELGSQKLMTGKAIGAAEEAANLNFQSTPEFEQLIKDPEKLSQISQTLGDWAKKGPDWVSQNVDPGTIQFMRKVAQEAPNKVSELANAAMQSGRETASQALEQLVPGFGDARKAHIAVLDAIKDLPKSAQTEKVALQNGLTRARQELAQVVARVSMLRKAALYTGGAAAGALGMKKLGGY